MSTDVRLLVRQQKGMAGRPWTQRLVLKGLGLSGPGSEVVVSNDRAIRGMIRKVLHLVSVEEVGTESAASSGSKAGASKATGSKAAGSKTAGAKVSAGSTKKVKS